MFSWSPSTATGCTGCRGRRRAICSSTSRAIRGGATRASNTSSGPSSSRTARGATTPAGPTTRAEEKAAFEAWIDWLMARLERHPDLHVFHYNAYEPTAIKRLCRAPRHPRAEVDDLLRRNVFVDLYGVVRQALRIGVESYGLKGLEPVHGFERSADARLAARMVGVPRDAAITRCSTRSPPTTRTTAARPSRCCDWLLDPPRRRRAPVRHRPRRARPTGARGPQRPTRSATSTGSSALREPLTGDLPDNEHDDDTDQRARRRLFDLLGYHRREGKPTWWEYFARLERTDDQLRDDDAEAIGDLTPVARHRPRGRRALLRMDAHLSRAGHQAR